MPRGHACSLVSDNLSILLGVVFLSLEQIVNFPKADRAQEGFMVTKDFYSEMATVSSFKILMKMLKNSVESRHQLDYIQFDRNVCTKSLHYFGTKYFVS